MANEDAIRSISQKEANEFLIEFFKKRNNSPVKYAELAQVLKEELQANTNQASGLIHRAHSGKGSVLIKTDKEYNLKMDACKQPSTLSNVKSQILEFKKELDKNISLNDVHSATEFNELKDLLKKLEELSQ